MKKIKCVSLLILIACAATIFLSCSTGNLSGEVPVSSSNNVSSAEPDWQRAEISAPSLSDNLIGESNVREISILLPQGYHNSGESYPVLYFLSGYGGLHNEAANMFASAMTELGTDNLIIVCIDGISRLSCSFYVNSPVTGNWQDYITTDIVNYLDKNYRTIPKSSARGLARHSVGGFGTLNIAMNTEGIFDFIYAMSPALFRSEGFTSYGLSLTAAEQSRDEYKELNGKSAQEAYLDLLDNPSWNMRYGYDYGSAFAPDPAAKAPYILFPKREADGSYLHDKVWKIYQSGFGGPAEQLGENQERLLRLGGLVMDYGRQDELFWLLEGCEYLAEQCLELANPIELRIYDGDHSSKIAERIVSEVIPYFSENLNSY